MIAPFTRQSFDHGATGFDAVQWDVATLKQIIVTEKMNYYDAFTIEEVLVASPVHILWTCNRLTTT